MLEVRIKPVEQLVFRGELVAVGKFRCVASHPLFRDSGPCSHHTIVFPRTVTKIRFAGGPSFVGHPGAAVLYNENQVYARGAISEIDASDWYTVADDVLLDLVPDGTRERPFSIAQLPCDAAMYLAQRRIFEDLERGHTPEHIEESLLLLLGTFLSRHKAAPPIDSVEAVKALIAANVTRVLPLRALAKAVNTTPFKLCRAFRAHTGMTMTEYRHMLRLRQSLARLRDRRVDLTELALDLGYASHSHFTAAFRRHFGTTPSAFRARS